MKSICFIATQLQLVNCIEYLNTIKSKRNVLIICASDKKRERQILDLLWSDYCQNIFYKQINISLKNNRYLNFVISFWHLFLLYSLSLFESYVNIVMGNYRMFYSRFFLFLHNKKSKCIVLDDGLATLTIMRDRKYELSEDKVTCFCHNRIFKKIIEKNKKSFIPPKVIFYTLFQDRNTNDKFIRNNYLYLKSNADTISFPNILFDADIVFLGQPLYTKGNCLTFSKYAEYLNAFRAQNNGLKIVYYAHPEENLQMWNKLNLSSSYIYIENTFPFELVCCILKMHCRVVSFYTSALINLLELNSRLIPESVYIHENNILNKKLSKDIQLCYKNFEKESIKIHKYDCAI